MWAAGSKMQAWPRTASGTDDQLNHIGLGGDTLLDHPIPGLIYGLLLVRFKGIHHIPTRHTGAVVLGTKGR